MKQLLFVAVVILVHEANGKARPPDVIARLLRDATEAEEFLPDSASCPVVFDRVGCYNEKREIIYGQLPSGEKLEEKLKPRLRRKICRCAMTAMKEDNIYFGLHLHDECWTSLDAEPDKKCDGGEPCQCSGGRPTDFVYQIRVEGSGGSGGSGDMPSEYKM